MRAAFKTETGSLYEVEQTSAGGWRARRLEAGPASDYTGTRIGPDSWSELAAEPEILVGESVVFLFGREGGWAKTTVTSRVVSIHFSGERSDQGESAKPQGGDALG